MFCEMTFDGRARSVARINNPTADSSSRAIKVSTTLTKGRKRSTQWEDQRKTNTKGEFVFTVGKGVRREQRSRRTKFIMISWTKIPHLLEQRKSCLSKVSLAIPTKVKFLVVIYEVYERERE